uniref:Peptidase M12A domain-containing protein n=1 Tax=Ditylenchus dipsaci TaxID=166011 RepID=A0A915DQQ2_9BILA
MHYEGNAFAVDKRTPTILPKLHSEGTTEMGQRVRLSVIDIQKINRLYNCTINEEYRVDSPHAHHHHRFSKTEHKMKERNAVNTNFPFTQTFILSGNNVQLAQSYSAYSQIQKEPKTNPAAFKSSQDFFVRTGLKPAGPVSYGVQLPDGSYLLSSSPSYSTTSSKSNGGVAESNDYLYPYSSNIVPGAQFSDNSVLPSATSANNHYVVHSPPLTSGDNIVCENAAQANCVDRKNDCVELAIKGECDKKPGLMLRMCRRSCCNCDDRKCYDTKDEQKYATLCLAQNRQSNSVVLSACDVPETKQNALDYCPRVCGTCVNYPSGGLLHKIQSNTS